LSRENKKKDYLCDALRLQYDRPHLSGFWWYLFVCHRLLKPLLLKNTVTALVPGVFFLFNFHFVKTQGALPLIHRAWLLID
jgi:hypothetical protein